MLTVGIGQAHAMRRIIPTIRGNHAIATFHDQRHVTDLTHGLSVIRAVRVKPRATIGTIRGGHTTHRLSILHARNHPP